MFKMHCSLVSAKPHLGLSRPHSLPWMTMARRKRDRGKWQAVQVETEIGERCKGRQGAQSQPACIRSTLTQSTCHY